MCSTKRHSFVVMATAYDYDDQHYYAEGGGYPMVVHTTREAAERRADRLAVEWVQKNDHYLYEYLWDGIDPDRVRELNDVFNRNWTEQEWLEWCPRGMSAWGAEHLLRIIGELGPYYVDVAELAEAA